MKVHIVQKGDTLWKISRQYGISFEELKRVNAHLANPDYIVPGMKIFLPETKENQTGKPKKGSGEEHHKKHDQKTNKPPVTKKEEEKPPVKKPVKEKLPVQKEPIPIPQAPTTHQPPKEPTPQMPHMQQWPQMPVQTIPLIGIPCGWFPIYDADCHHHAHMEQMPHHVPTPTPKPTPLPKPMPMPQMPQMELESPLHTEHHLTVKPSPPVKEWDRKDSTSLPFPQKPMQHESMPPPMQQMPETMPLPQMPEAMPMPQMPIQQQMPTQMAPCGCYYQMMPLMHQDMNHCYTCQQPMPHQMMPMQGQNPNWHGYY